VVPANERFAIKDTCIPRGGGPDGLSPVYVAKGEAIGYNTYAMHRYPKIWGDDAAEFKPERWDTMRQGWHYLPFNGGCVTLYPIYTDPREHFVNVREQTTRLSRTAVRSDRSVVRDCASFAALCMS